MCPYGILSSTISFSSIHAGTDGRRRRRRGSCRIPSLRKRVSPSLNPRAHLRNPPSYHITGVTDGGRSARPPRQNARLISAAGAETSSFSNSKEPFPMPLPSVRPGPQTDRISSFRKWGMKGRTGAIHKVSKHLLVGGGQNGLSERGGVNLRTRERRV